MGRWLVVVIAFVPLAAIGCGSDDSASDEAVDTASFTSPVYGYTIDHPAEWSLVEAERPLDDGEEPRTGNGGTDILGVGASTRVSTMELPGLIVAAHDVPEGTTTEAWVETVVDQVTFMKGCPPPRSREPLEMGGEPAVMLDYPDCPPDSGFDHLWTVVVHDDRAFQFVWFDTVGHPEADRDELDEMLGTVTFAAS